MIHRHATSLRLASGIIVSALITAGCSAEVFDDSANPDGNLATVSSAIVSTNTKYEIKAVHSGKCLDIHNFGTANGDNVQQWSCTGNTNQQFTFEEMGNGYYRIRNVNSNKCLDVWGYSSSNGTNIAQYTCGTGYNQQFQLVDEGSGVYHFIARHSGKAIDIAGVSNSDGANALQWTWQQSNNQKFYVTQVGGQGRIFDECRFHFGTIDSFARDNAGIREQIDYFTPGWMGYADTFDQSYVCDEANGILSGKVPVVVAYVAAFYVKRHYNLCDCNVYSCGANNDLCTYGSQRIQENLNAIINVYKDYAQGYANCYGTTKPIVFEMEPDWYQYTYSSQTDPMSAAEASSILNQFVATIKQYLPNARFSMDISPWVQPNNGSDNGQWWYGNFNMDQFSFINTSGGSTEAANTLIRSTNNMTWSGVSNVTGKPILADTGYGAAGVSAGHDYNWDNPTYINARMADGVSGLNQYNPDSNWGDTIKNIRGQLGTPKYCP